jgi:hypothetical protein
MNPPHRQANGSFRCPNCNATMIYRASPDCYSCMRCTMDYTTEIMVKDRPIWVTAKREIMDVRDMETTHIQFSINKILDNMPGRNHMMPYLLEELRQRKEKEAA